MESILLPPFMREETPEALSQDAAEELRAILTLCERLLKASDTRVIFTSREALPAPFNSARNRRELYQLDRDDAVKLIERVLNAAGDNVGASSDAAREEIEQLVDAVHCHARTLALLAPSLQKYGVETTCESLIELMEDMEKRFPGSREKSVFASVELSLRRMSQANQDRVRVLGVFHGAVDLDVLRHMMQWQEKDLTSLALELVVTGLATPNRYNHLTLNPALCPYLRGRMNAEQRDELTVRWMEATIGYVEFLRQQRQRNAEVASTLTVLDLPNLFALLDLVQVLLDAEATIGLAATIYGLIQGLGKPILLERVGHVRDTTAATLGNTWNHAQFEAARTRIEQQLDTGRLRQALEGALELHRRTYDAGKQAYSNADYDLAAACWLLGRVLEIIGESERALPLLDEARQRFETFALTHSGIGAEGMAAKCFSEIGDCLVNLGRLDEAVAAYDECIRRSEQVGDSRSVAVAKSQIASILSIQHYSSEALAALGEARERFTELDEPGSVAIIWQQMGSVYSEAGEPQEAEDAYRKSLAIKVRLGNTAGQASTLVELGSLYMKLRRTEEAVPFYKQAAEKYAEITDFKNEGKARSGLASAFLILGRLDDARQEIQRSIKCAESSGHDIEPWKFWQILSGIETRAKNSTAAADAKRKAIKCYFAYRRDGGENHDSEGRISLAVTESLLAGDEAAAATLLQELATDPRSTGSLGTYLHALEAIVNGSRDRTLADGPDLHYGMATEILFLIETLEKRG